MSNSFLILSSFEVPEDGITNALQTVVDDKTLDTRLRTSVTEKERTFRVIASEKNEFIPIPQTALDSVERRIARVTGLRPDRARPNVEYWCYLRREGCGFFGKRLTRPKATERELHKGELRPDVANILCQISEPSAEDIFLDPFCGYGAIPLQRVSIPHNLAFASDRDPALIQLLKNRIKQEAAGKDGRLRKMIVRAEDALKLDRYDNGFIHKIVTDPPWGLYEDVGTPIHDFYRRMLEEMARVVRSNGLIVILTAQKDVLESCLSMFQDRLAVVERMDILLSGKKAAVFKLLRK